MIHNSTKQKVRNLLKQYSWKLTHEEILITHCYLGFFDNREMTKEEIGKLLHIDPKQVNTQLHTIFIKLVGRKKRFRLAA